LAHRVEVLSCLASSAQRSEAEMTLAPARTGLLQLELPLARAAQRAARPVRPPEAESGGLARVALHAKHWPHVRNAAEEPEPRSIEVVASPSCPLKSLLKVCNQVLMPKCY